MSYKINLRFRRFCCGTGQVTGLIVYYIERKVPFTPRGSTSPRPTISLKMGTKPEPATISPCTFTMDHNAIICSMIDRPARGPDADVHVPSVGSTRVPFSWCRIHILVVDYRWGSMGSDETAITIPGALEKLTFFTGTGRHRGHIIYFFRM